MVTTLPEYKMRLALARLGYEKKVVKKCQKLTILRGGDIEWRIRAIFGSCELTKVSYRNGSRLVLPASEVEFALAFLRSEK